MPRILRARFVHVGHENARMDDLILRFHDAEYRPTDSTIWLRNGGGKSSILNLLFALILPDRRDFLGGRPAQRERTIDHYIHDAEPGYVIIEWELDDPALLKQTGIQPQHYLTGVIYEKRPGVQDDPGRLQRLFFAVRVIDTEPKLTLEGLPVYTINQDKLNTITLFKQEWQALITRYSAAEFRETEYQHIWHGILQSVGIDPALYSYQVQMNQREGEADQLFKFSDTNDFVHFFLELALDPQPGTLVAESIATFRTKLHNLLYLWQPERNLFETLLTNLEPLRDAYRQRLTHMEDMSRLRVHLAQITQHIEQQQATLHESLKTMQQELEAARGQETTLTQRLEQQQQIVNLWQYLATQQNLDQAKEKLVHTQQAITKAQEQISIWQATKPLYRLQQVENEITDLESRLHQQQTHLAPAYAALQDAAHRYAAALQARLFELEDEDDEYLAVQQQARLAEQSLRRQVETSIAQHTEAGMKVKQYTERLQDYVSFYNELIAQHILLASEDWRTAHQRLNQLLQQTQQAHHEVQAKRQQLEDTINNYPLLRIQAEHQQQLAQQQEQAAQALLTSARQEQHSLEQNPALQRYLETPQINLATLDDTALLQLRRAERSVGEAAFRIWQTIIQRQRNLEALEHSGYLPPDPLVTRLLEYLDQHEVVAWSGWRYIRENLNTLERIKEYVKQSPDIVTGIVVRDDLFADIDSKVQKAPFDLDRPITFVRQSAILVNKPYETVVVGPTTTAYYDRGSAEQLLVSYQTHQQTDEQQLESLRDQQTQLHALLTRLNLFRVTYPAQWFNEQIALVNKVQAQQHDLQLYIEKLDQTFSAQRIELSKLMSENEALAAQEITLQQHLSLVAQGQQQYPEERAGLDAQRSIWQERLLQAKIDQQHHTQAINDQLQHIHQTEEARRKLAGRLQSLRDLRNAITEVEEQGPAIQGDWEQLRLKYDVVRADYQHEINHDQLANRLTDRQQLAKEYRLEFIQTCETAELKQKDVEHALQTITSKQEIQDNLDAAIKHFGQTQANVVTVNEEIAHLQTELDQLTHFLTPEQFAAWHEQSGTSQINPIEQLHDAQAVHQGILQALHQHQASIATFQLRSKDIQDDAIAYDRYTQDSIRLREAASQLHLRMLPDQESLVLPSLPSSELTLALIPLLIRQSNDQFQATLRAWDHLDRQLTNVSDAIRTTLSNEQFSQLQGQHIRTLRSYKNQDFEAGFEQLTQELMRRLRIIEKDISDLQPNKNQIVEQTLHIAKRGVTLLKSLTRRSKLPSTLPAFAGQSFLRVTLNDELELPEQRLRMTNLLDQIIQAHTIPSGIDLVQQGIRCICDNIRIEILFPHLHAHKRYDDIPKLALRSGGERLTCAIMLYCTLAQLRAHQLGQITGSSTLLLDNPIGKASHSDFLMLQREMARSMHIQLIYTTALDDLEAIKHFPNIERLRNTYFDLVTNERVIERDDQALAQYTPELSIEKSLTSARIFFVSEDSHEENDDNSV